MTEYSADVARVIDYHERTKHRFDGYARGPDTIDWEAQPKLFRHFEGAPHRDLPFQPSDEGPSYANLYEARNEMPLDWSEATISRLLQFSLALSAWKQYGTSRWSLRCNPSSGNLHPTEAYLIFLGIDGFENGLHHYWVNQHRLELRCRYPDAEISGPQLLIGFSSVYWREAWKYGERAYRYCQHDLGHALAALSYAATLLGYRVTPFPEIGTSMLQRLLGLDRSEEFYSNEAEHGDILVCLHPVDVPPLCPVKDLLELTDQGEWYGRANLLDPSHHYDWPLIEEVAKAAQYPSRTREQSNPEQWPKTQAAASHPLSQQSAQKLFLQRRSTQAFDASSQMTRVDFFRMMDRLLPRSNLPPWSSQAWETSLHLVLFIHGVEGLAPGLYLLLRSKTALDTLRPQLRDDLQWETVDGAPEYLPFYSLARAKTRRTAMRLSCQQDIAGDSAFSLAMLAEFETAINDAPWRYNELHYEAGMIGQSLYLEAEAIGMRGTGIGCFFDDGVHELLGIKGKALQVIYHFTVGTPINDPRLATLPPYPQQET